jgi:hypothetical protein
MMALLRYAFLKSAREKFLVALLISPAVMLLAPLLGVAALALLQGHGTWPLSIDPRWPPFATSRLMASVGVMLSAISAGAGGFWIFRRERANHSLGSFALAIQTRAIALAATIYGSFAGIVSFLLVVACATALTSCVPPNVWITFAMSIASSLFASALGTALVALSSEASMLMPLYAGSVLVSLLLLNAKNHLFFVAMAAAGAVLLTAGASILMRRRCAT